MKKNRLVILLIVTIWSVFVLCACSQNIESQIDSSIYDSDTLKVAILDIGKADAIILKPTIIQFLLTRDTM